MFLSLPSLDITAATWLHGAFLALENARQRLRTGQLSRPVESAVDFI